MPWYAAGALAGARMPFAIWLRGIRPRLRDGGTGYAAGFHAEARVIGAPIRLPERSRHTSSRRRCRRRPGVGGNGGTTRYEAGRSGRDPA